jgi:alkylated DNA repair dioxygenase AlkB
MSEQPGLAIDRQAPTERTALGDTAWVDFTQGFVVESHQAMQRLLQRTPWQSTEVLRYDRYVPEKRLSAGLRADAEALTRQAQMHLEARYRHQLSGVAAILYRNGDDFQGLHSDREMRWLDDTIVAIIVLGQRRPFVFRQRKGDASFVDRTPAGQLPGDITLLPGEGDLLVMGGACQRDWLHGVPAASTDLPRISLTWRWAARTGRPDTSPGYYEGRQYSDRPRQQGYRTRPAG